MPDYVRVAAHDIPARRAELSADWRVVNDHQLEREVRFPDFASALAFTNAVGAIADALNHHPDIHLGWGKVALVIWTHAADGLTESDFELAKKIDSL